jgi:hypothetical protein
MTNCEAATESADLIAHESEQAKSPIHGLHPRLSKLVRDEQEEGAVVDWRT